MDYFSFTKAGRAWNEDRCYVCEDYGFVLDGATGFTKQKFSEYTSDAEWFSDTWKDYLIEALKDMSKSLNTIVKEGIEVVKQKMDLLSKNQTIEDYPSSTISMFRINGDSIEYFVLGDSPMIFLTNHNQCFYFMSEALLRNDDINKAIVQDYAIKNNVDMITARYKYGQCILDGRSLKNTSDAYYILADDVNAIQHSLYGKIPKHIISKILVLSDGYSQICEVFKKCSFEELVKKINSLKDATKMYNKLYKWQEKDKQCNKYIRFKTRDDSSLVEYIV